MPAGALSEDAPLYDRPLARPGDFDARGGRRPRCAPRPGRLRPRRPAGSLADAAWVYRQYDHQLFLNTVEGPAATPPSCAWPRRGCPRRPRAWRSPPTPIPRWCAIDPRAGTAADRGRRRRSTWPAPGPGRWPWSTASTSATPSTPRSCGSSPRRSTGCARPASASGCRSSAATSASTTRATERTSTPHRSSGCSDSSTGWPCPRPGSPWWRRPRWSCWTPAWVPPGPDRVRPRWPAPAGPSRSGATATARCRRSTSPVTPVWWRWSPPWWRTGRHGAGGAALVSGIHDVSGGGLGVALAEMAVRSGIGLQVSGIADHHELFTEAPSRVVVCTTRTAELVPGPPRPEWASGCWAGPAATASWWTAWWT